MAPLCQSNATTRDLPCLTHNLGQSVIGKAIPIQGIAFGVTSWVLWPDGPLGTLAFLTEPLGLRLCLLPGFKQTADYVTFGAGSDLFDVPAFFELLVRMTTMDNTVSHTRLTKVPFRSSMEGPNSSCAFLMRYAAWAPL